MAKFNDAIGYVLNNEGGYVDRATDKGGPTNFGITLAILEKWNKRATSVTEIQNLPVDVAKVIYNTWWWKPLRGDDVVDQEVATAMLDISVNVGVPNGSKMIQRAVGSSPDGKIGDTTIAKINECSRLYFFKVFIGAVQDHYVDIVIADSAEIVNLKGWLHRSQKLVTLVG